MAKGNCRESRDKGPVFSCVAVGQDCICLLPSTSATEAFTFHVCGFLRRSVYATTDGIEHAMVLSACSTSHARWLDERRVLALARNPKECRHDVVISISRSHAAPLRRKILSLQSMSAKYVALGAQHGTDPRNPIQPRRSTSRNPTVSVLRSEMLSLLLRDASVGLA